MSDEELRDVFAASALIAILQQGYIGQWSGSFDPGLTEEVTKAWGVGRLAAFEAYGFADAMMAERGRRAPVGPAPDVRGEG